MSNQQPAAGGVCAEHLPLLRSTLPNPAVDAVLPFSSPWAG
jgi:hypothetical protein